MGSDCEYVCECWLVNCCSLTSGDSDRTDLAMGAMGKRVLHDITLETYSPQGKCVMETVSYTIHDNIQLFAESSC